MNDLDLLHHRQAEALRGSTLQLALHGERVDRLADVLRGRELHDLQQAELCVDVDNGAVRGERVLHVGVGLARLRVERKRLARVELAGLVDDLVAEQRRERHHQLARAGDDVLVLDVQAAGGPKLGAGHGDDAFAHRIAGGLHRAAGDVCLPRGGRRARRPHIGVGVEHHDVVHS